jgi:hypothetical protein
LQTKGLAVGGQRRARFRIGIEVLGVQDRTRPGIWCDVGNARPIRRETDIGYAGACAERGGGVEMLVALFGGRRGRAKGDEQQKPSQWTSLSGRYLNIVFNGRDDRI